MIRVHSCIIMMALLPASFLSAADAVTSSDSKEDDAAVRTVVQLYFDGIIQYDEAALRSAFHPDARIIGVNKEGKVESVPFQEWVLYTRGTAPDPAGRNNTIISVDITGAAALVKVDLNWPHVRYTDYLSLLKDADGWRIVNKIFHKAPPETRQAE